MNIRFARIEDCDSILSLLDELIDEVNKKSGKPPKFTEGNDIRKKFYKELLERSDVKIFVVEEDSKLIGMADLFILPLIRRGYYQGHLEDLVISEGVRGKGIGTALMNAVKEYCKNNDVKVLKLTSGNELQDAHNFYEKVGGISTEKMFRFNIK